MGRTGKILLMLICFASTALAEEHARKAKPKPKNEASKPTRSGQPTQEEIAEGKANAKKARKNSAALAEYHFAMAQAYSAEGNPDRAIEEYKLTLMFDPNSALVHTRLAAEYIKKGMLSAAMESCKEALKLEPQFVDARLMLAGLYSTIRENETALREYNRVLKQDPTHEEAITYKAQVLLEENRAKEAVKTLKAFIKRVPESVIAWYYLGRANQDLDNLAGAEKAFRKAFKLNPHFGQAALSLGFLFEQRGKKDRAIQVYEELYEQTQNVTAANRIATLYLKEEKYDKALVYLRAIQALDPDNLNAQVKLGLVQMELKRYDEAIKTFNDIQKKNPDAERIHYYLGSLYEETKKFKLAIKELKKIKPESKLYEDATLHITFLLKQQGKESEAIDYIESAIKKEPKLANFRVFYASLREDKGDLNRAVEILESALEDFPENERIRYYLGSLYDRQGRVEESLAQMEAILAENPDNADALNYIGYTWTVKGIRLNDAEKLLRKALKLKPENGYIVDSWGWYLFSRGRVKEAIVELEKAIILKPNEPTILDHLGDAYVKSNLREKALQSYMEAMRFSKDEKKRTELKAKIENVRSALAKDKTKSKDRVRAPAKKK